MGGHVSAARGVHHGSNVILPTGDRKSCEQRRREGGGGEGGCGENAAVAGGGGKDNEEKETRERARTARSRRNRSCDFDRKRTSAASIRTTPFSRPVDVSVGVSVGISVGVSEEPVGPQALVSTCCWSPSTLGSLPWASMAPTLFVGSWTRAVASMETKITMSTTAPHFIMAELRDAVSISLLLEGEGAGDG